MSLSSRSPAGGAERAAAFVSAGLVLATALVFLSPSAAAIPGEPTVEVRVTPTEVPVDASGISPVDASFSVLVTGNNLGVRSHTMWVNISFGTSTGWKVQPLGVNLTLTLDPQGSDSENISVTVTVPPKVSANVAATFFASYREENTLRFSTGATGNATAQITILPIYSTFAEFANGTSNVQVRQGEDTDVLVKVTNRGNGDTRYDAQLLNAAELRPNDVVLQQTTPADVAQNGSASVRMVIHANRAAIAGTYVLQVRVVAVGAPVPPPAGAFADLTAQLTVTPGATPPPTNNTTQPPPPTNTTPPPQQQPPPSNPSMIETIVNFVGTPTGMISAGSIAGVLILLAIVARSSKAAKRKRAAALERARHKHQGPAKPGVPGGAPMRPVGAPMRPQAGPPGRPIRPVAPQRPGGPGGPGAMRGPPAK